MRALALAVSITVSSFAARGEAPSVYPSGDEIPENLLRLSLSFAEPTAPGVLERLSLRAADGALIAQPFLEQELWSPDAKTLTLLLHPGRVKSGLRAHDEAGRPLHRGDQVSLIRDGASLKTWRIGPARAAAPDLRRWIIHAPQAGTRGAVVVALDAPIDAQAIGYLAVVSVRGRRVRGHPTLASGENVWHFNPESPWSEGPYRLMVHPRLEDPQGNAIGGRFEQKVGVSATNTTTPVELHFVVLPSAGTQ
jgi:hypothetical protein